MATLTVATLAAGTTAVLADAAVKGAVLLALASLAAVALRRTSAATRHLVWALAVTAVLLVPALSAVLPGWRVLPRWEVDAGETQAAVPAAAAETPRVAAAAVRVDPLAAAPASGAAGGPRLEPPALTNKAAAPNSVPSAPVPQRLPRPLLAEVAEPAPAQAPASPPPAAEARTLPDWRSLVLWTWAAGAAMALLPALVAAARLWRIGRRVMPLTQGRCAQMLEALRAEIGLRRRVRLVMGDPGAMPMTWGVLRPVVLLPQDCDQWPRARLRTVLLHELAHVRRLDCLSQWIAVLARAAHWFNPLAWLAAWRLRVERERACDDLVLAHGQKASDYAGLVVEVAVRSSRRPMLAAAVGMARRSGLEGRVRDILDERRNRRALTRAAVAVSVVALAAVALPVAMVRSADRAAEAAKATDGPKNKPPTTSPSGRTVRGRVVDALGRPRANVYLTSDWPGRTGWGTQSDDEGQFTLTGVQPAQTHWLAWSQATDRYGLFKLPPGDGPVTVRVDLESVDVEGRLVDAEGRPVIKRDVQARVIMPDGEHFESGKVKTEDDGYYRINAPAGKGSTVEVRAASEGGTWTPWSHRTEAFGRLPVDMPDLAVTGAGKGRIAPRVTYSGVIQDEAGRAVTGAVVRVDYRVNSKHMSIYVREAKSDARGRWALKLPAALYDVSVRVEHPDYLSSVFENSTSPPGDRLRDGTAVSVLKKGIEFIGEVQDEQGRPVNDALVLTQPLISSTGGLGEPIEDATMGRSGPDGVFRVGALPPGPRELVVYAPRFAPRVVKIDVQKGMSPAGITMKPGGRVSGRVVDAAGKPLGDVRVHADDWKVETEHRLPRQTVTDAEGRFQLKDMPTEGTFRVMYSRRGKASRWDDDFILTNSAELKAREEPYELVLHRTPSVEGKVVDDATGQPITEFEVQQGTAGRDAELKFNDRDRRTVKSAEGTFTARLERYIASPPYPLFAVRVRAAGYLPEVTKPIKIGETLSPVTLRLRRGAPMKGTILAADGSPAAGAEVAWVDPNRTAYVQDGRLLGGWGNSPEVVVQSRADGRFELPASDARGKIVALHAGGYAVLDPAGAKEGAASQTDVRLTAWARVEGVIRTGDKPAAGARVTLELQGAGAAPGAGRARPPVQWMLGTTAHTTGEFRIGHVPAETMAVGWSTTAGLSHAQMITPRGGETVRVSIGGDGARLEGRILLPEGVPADAFHERFEVGRYHMRAFATPAAAAPSTQPAEARPVFAGSIREDGRLTIDGLPPGRYDVTVNLHAPPQPNTCGIPLVLASASKRIDLADKSASRTIDAGELPLAPAERPAAGTPIPKLQGKTVTGEDFSLDQYRGKVIVLDFWATWCGPCRAATPRVREIHENYARGGKLAVVGITFDHQPETARAYAESEKLPWPNVLADGWGQDAAIVRTFGISAIPSLWVIGADGKVIARDVPVEQLEKVVAQAMK